jgi:hypothetical protein
VVEELAGVFCQGKKGALRNVFSKVGVRNHPQGGRMDQVDVPADKFGESSLRAMLGVVGHKLLVGSAVHS